MKKFLIIILIIVNLNSFGQQGEAPFKVTFVEELKFNKHFIDPIISPDNSKLLFSKNNELFVSDFSIDVLDTVFVKRVSIRNCEWLTDSTIRFNENYKTEKFIYNLNTKEIAAYVYQVGEIFIEYSSFSSKVKKYVNEGFETLANSDEFTFRMYISPDKKYVLAYQPRNNRYRDRTVIYDLTTGEQINILENSMPSGWCSDSKHFIYYTFKKINEDTHGEKVIESDLLLTNIELNNKWNLTNSKDIIETCNYITNDLLVVRDINEHKVYIYKIEKNGSR